MTPRIAAVKALTPVISGKSSLARSLPLAIETLDHSQRAWVQALVYGTVRLGPRWPCLLKRWLKRPLRQQDADIQAVLWLGLYQLFHMQTAEHAAVNESVQLAQNLKKPWAKSLINAVLRSAQRAKASGEWASWLAEDAVAQWAHPQWWINRLKQDWPNDWGNILNANNQQAPMTLRVNQQKMTRSQYLEKLQAQGMQATKTVFGDDGLVLNTPCDVMQLPGFSQGWVSVQDESAQMAALWLCTTEDEHVLDACSAPGGKAAHWLESNPKLNLLALDQDPKRLLRVTDNFQRLGLSGRTKAADACDLKSWWDGRFFSQILLDAPCSASGVVRRRPDIKCTRRDSDIEALHQSQVKLLKALWQVLEPNGRMLYVTCSVFRQENDHSVQAFLQTNTDAKIEKIHAHWGQETATGRQFLPQITMQTHGLDTHSSETYSSDQDAIPLIDENVAHPNKSGDGFFYAKLKKLRATG